MIKYLPADSQFTNESELIFFSGLGLIRELLPTATLLSDEGQKCLPEIHSHKSSR